MMVFMLYGSKESQVLSTGFSQIFSYHDVSHKINNRISCIEYPSFHMYIVKKISITYQYGNFIWCHAVLRGQTTVQYCIGGHVNGVSDYKKTRRSKIQKNYSQPPRP